MSHPDPSKGSYKDDKIFCYQCNEEIKRDDAEIENHIGEYICESCHESGFDISLEDR